MGQIALICVAIFCLSIAAMSFTENSWSKYYPSNHKLGLLLLALHGICKIICWFSIFAFLVVMFKMIWYNV
jgi:hypothetical protein